MWTKAYCFFFLLGGICKQTGKKLNALGRMCDMLSTEDKLTLVRIFILCHFNFCPTVWTYCSVTDTKQEVQGPWRSA